MSRGGNMIIKSVAQLKKLAQKEGGLDCYIALNYGLRSSKNISYDIGGCFYVFNEIDGTSQELSESMLFTDSNIGEAIKKGALICATEE